MRAGTLLLGGLFALAGVACGGGDRGESFELYHLETAIGPPGAEGELRCGPPREACPGIVRQPAPREVRYRVLGAPALEGDGIDRTSIEAAGDLVSISFTAEGIEAFERLTREVARHGGRDQAWHHVAVVVGDEIVAFPEIDFDQYPNGIPDPPGLQVAMSSTAAAEALVERLRGS